MGWADQAATLVLAFFWSLIAAGLLLLASRALGLRSRRAPPGLAEVLRRRLTSGPDDRHG